MWLVFKNNSLLSAQRTLQIRIVTAVVDPLPHEHCASRAQTRKRKVHATVQPTLARENGGGRSIC